MISLFTSKIILYLILFLFSSLVYSQITERYNENFNNNFQKWYTSDKDPLKAYISNGFYKIKNSDFNSKKILYNVEILEDFDFVLETEIIQTEGKDNNAFGLVWGAKNENNYFAFIITSNGNFTIIKSNEGKIDKIKSWTGSINISYLNDKNKLTIKNNKKQYEFYINDFSVFKIDKINFMGKNVGFYISNKISLDVNYLLLLQDSNNINLIENPINGYIKENLGSNINTAFNEIMPVISADGKTLYIARYCNNIVNGKLLNDIWYSIYEKSKWSPIRDIGYPLNIKGNYSSVISVSPDNNTLYLGYLYNPNGTTSTGGISKSHRIVDGWSFPENIIINKFINKNNFLSFCLGADNETLLMSIESDNSFGGLDLYVSFKNYNGFSEPTNLSNLINTTGDEITPFLAPDNVTLYFSSNGREGFGNYDVYMTRRLDDSWTNWSEPINLGANINTNGSESAFVIPASGEYAYIVSDQDSYGQNDIFKIKVPVDLKPLPMILISGKVLDNKTKLPISAEIKYYDISNNKLAGTAISNSIDGTYKIVLPFGKKYSFWALKDGYFSTSDFFDCSKITKYDEIQKDLYLNEIEVGSKIRLNNVFFDVKLFEIEKESLGELERLLIFLKNNPKIKISINGHTDSDGANSYNYQLSFKRANSVRDYLVKNSIQKNRIKLNAFGEINPYSDNKSIIGKSLNRRVEFVILNK